MFKEEFLKKLRSAFDLNIYEVKIWAALLSKGLATAGELSEISGVPRSRSYDVLEGLEKKGFAVMKLGKPIKYIAVDPKEVLKRVKKSIVDNSDEKVKIIDNVKGTNLYKDLELLFKQGVEHLDVNALSGVIKGRKNIYNQIETMVGSAKKSVLISTTAGGFLRKMDHFGSTLKRLGNNGVKVKVITPKNEDIRKMANELKNINFKFSNSNGRFVIVDGKEVMFMVNEDKAVHENYDIGIWAKTDYFAKALENMSNSLR